MVLGMASPPVDHKWEYQINDSPPSITMDPFTITGANCADIINYKIYDDINGIIENTVLDIIFDVTLNQIVITKNTDINLEDTFAFYI